MVQESRPEDRVLPVFGLHVPNRIFPLVSTIWLSTVCGRCLLNFARSRMEYVPLEAVKEVSIDTGLF